MTDAANVELLQDLLDLDDCGERVSWPNGLTAEGARKLVETWKFKQEVSKPQAPPSAGAASAPASSSASAGAAAPAAPVVSEADTRVYIEAFRCPITQQLMREPVVTPSGHSYEGEAIRKVAKEMGFSPQTKRRLRAIELVPNRALADAIEQTRVQRRQDEAAKSEAKIEGEAAKVEASIEGQRATVSPAVAAAMGSAARGAAVRGAKSDAAAGRHAAAKASAKASAAVAAIVAASGASARESSTPATPARKRARTLMAQLSAPKEVDLARRGG